MARCVALGRAPASGREGREPLDAVTWATRGQLGEVLQAAFQVGDDLQHEWTGLASDALVPWRWSRTASELAERSVAALQLASPGAVGGLARQELRNKFEVYWLVKGARGKLELPRDSTSLPLTELIPRAYQLGDYQALWVVEGLGYEIAAAALRADSAPRGLFVAEAVGDLPPNSVPMLHGGLGLACAEHVMQGLSPHSSTAEVSAAAQRFLDLCRDNSMERYVDSAIEAFGLYARCFVPELVPVLERGLVALDDATLHRYFWHGFGRAIYFLPVHFVPGYGTLWRAVQVAIREAPHEMARKNALAGVSFAFTMVNMSHPEILERALCRHGDEILGSTFADGVVAAVVMRNEITPRATVLEAFVEHEPRPEARAIWQQVVRLPCRQALGQNGLDPARNELPGVYRALSHGPGAGRPEEARER